MGIVIAAVYLPLLALCTLVTLFASRFAFRISPRAAQSRGIDAALYVLGMALSIVCSLVSASKIEFQRNTDFAALFMRIGVTLAVPVVFGILLLGITYAVHHLRPFSRLGYLTAGVLHSTIAVPLAAVAVMALYDDVVYGPAFRGLCKHSTVQFVQEIKPAVSVALLPDRILAATRGQQPTGVQLGEALIVNTRLDAVERLPLEIDKVPIGTPFVRLTKNARNRASDYPDVTAIERDEAEYQVVSTQLEIPADLKLRMGGTRVEIRRASDQQLIAFTQYYWDREKFWVCPSVAGESRFLYDFLSDALNVRNSTRDWKKTSKDG